MKRPSSVPACTCGAANGVEASHQASCAWAQHALTLMGARPGRRGGVGSDGLGLRSRHQTAKVTERRGIRFKSRLEADVFDRLWDLRARVPGSEVLRQPRFDLWRSWTPGMGRPLCFTPDFLLVRPRHVARALEVIELYDSVLAREGPGYQEKALDLFDVEVHEAKTSRGQESQDYVRGLAAFRAEHPGWPFVVWRRPAHARTGLAEERLAELVAQGGA